MSTNPGNAIAGTVVEGRRFDVLGIGNAIVDVIAHADDGFLRDAGLAKGAMTLIDAAAAESLYARMGQAVEASGGSAANTIAGLAALGGRGAFIGKVRNDQLGGIFAHDIRALGVAFDTPPATTGAATARCLIFVTPDAQRTMQTFLGVSWHARARRHRRNAGARRRRHLPRGLPVGSARGQAGLREGGEDRPQAGNMVALSLSDAFCVDRHRADFLRLVEGHVDILFANESEILSLYQVDDFDDGTPEGARPLPDRRADPLRKGLGGDRRRRASRDRRGAVGKVVDTTGAGDLYAAGFLYGLTQGRSLHDCGRIGSICAGEIIGHYGARPEAPLDALVARALA